MAVNQFFSMRGCVLVIKSANPAYQYDKDVTDARSCLHQCHAIDHPQPIKSPKYKALCGGSARRRVFRRVSYAASVAIWSCVSLPSFACNLATSSML